MNNHSIKDIKSIVFKQRLSKIFKDIKHSKSPLF